MLIKHFSSGIHRDIQHFVALKFVRRVSWKNEVYLFLLFSEAGRSRTNRDISPISPRPSKRERRYSPQTDRSPQDRRSRQNAERERERSKNSSRHLQTSNEDRDRSHRAAEKDSDRQKKQLEREVDSPPKSSRSSKKTSEKYRNERPERNERKEKHVVSGPVTPPDEDMPPDEGTLMAEIRRHDRSRSVSRPTDGSLASVLMKERLSQQNSPSTPSRTMAEQPSSMSSTRSPLKKETDVKKEAPVQTLPSSISPYASLPLPTVSNVSLLEHAPRRLKQPVV